MSFEICPPRGPEEVIWLHAMLETRISEEVALQVQTVSREELESAEVEQLLQGDEFSMVYPTSGFLAFLAEAANCDVHVVTARRAGRLVGILPFASRTDPRWGQVLNSLPWYGTYGGCHVARQDDVECRQALLRVFAKLASAPGVLSAQITVRPAEMPFRDLYGRMLGNPIEHPLRLQWTTIPEATEALEQDLMAVYRQKTRNLVRKALNQGFEHEDCDEDWAWDFLARTHATNMQVIGGQPKPVSHFEALRHHVPRARRRLLIAHLRGTPAAALLLLFYNRTVEYLTPVIQHEFRPYQPLSFLIHHGMKMAAQAGFRHWNWGGTWESQASLHHFKEGFGAQTLPYCYWVVSPPERRDAMRARLPEVRAGFPYFYLYPFHLLEERT